LPEFHSIRKFLGGQLAGIPEILPGVSLLEQGVNQEWNGGSKGTGIIISRIFCEKVRFIWNEMAIVKIVTRVSLFPINFISLLLKAWRPTFCGLA
jgi:hypothetical protein